MLVYKITNLENGKSYIGVTRCSVEKRWREHRCSANTGNQNPLYRAIRKYGEGAFDVSVLYEASSPDELKAVERGLIAQYGTYYLGGRGYNMTNGGDGMHYVNRRRGEESSLSVLTEEVVAFIRDPEKVGICNAEMVDLVAERFGNKFEQDTLKCARNGKNWRHLNTQHPPVKMTKRGGRQRPVPAENKAKSVEALHAHRAEALKKSAEMIRGKRAKHAKMNFDQVRDIFYGTESLVKTAQQHGVSKKMVLLIRQQRVYTYWTKEFHRA